MDVDIQLDDMWMPEGAHVLDLTLDPGLGFGHVDDGLGDILHGDPLSSDGMCRHWQDEKKGDQPGTKGRSASARDVLLTFPKVPSAMSPMTVYSPSLEAENSIGMSSIWKGRQRCRRRRRWCPARAVLKKDLSWSWPMQVGLRMRPGSHLQII